MVTLQEPSVEEKKATAVAQKKAFEDRFVRTAAFAILSPQPDRLNLSVRDLVTEKTRQEASSGFRKRRGEQEAKERTMCMLFVTACYIRYYAYTEPSLQPLMRKRLQNTNPGCWAIPGPG
jgi:hypothetical protein